jgi:hypothetical protein
VNATSADSAESKTLESLDAELLDLIQPASVNVPKLAKLLQVVGSCPESVGDAESLGDLSLSDMRFRPAHRHDEVAESSTWACCGPVVNHLRSLASGCSGCCGGGDNRWHVGGWAS